jgi:glycerol-3-phosphate dehydrogenase (NAD(P)+)
VRLWVREPARAEELRARGENAKYLPGVPLPASVQPTARLEEAAREADAIIVAVPSEHARGTYRELGRHVKAGAVLISATKGFELERLLRMSEVAAEEVPAARVTVLSGPSFAQEVAQEQPTAVVVASTDVAAAEEVQRALSNRRFRVYSSQDVVGAETAGALKNVIAIAAGILDGIGYGHNTVAALITRGLAETSRLAVAMGGRPDTLAGLAGLGDLVLTCTGGLSRNRRLGQALGAGRTLAEALSASPMVAEGIRTTIAACELAARHAVEMPIAAQMRRVLHEGLAPREAVDALMLRSLKRE